MRKKRKGFTLIELVMVIVIIGILAAVAIPRFFGLQANARQAAEQGVVGAVRSGISTSFANACASGTCAWPATLDAIAVFPTTCGAGADACFTNVLEQGGYTQDDWEHTTATTYTGPTGTVYGYTAATGTFQ